LKLLVISPAAQGDLRKIATYIAADNPDRAASFVVELRAKMDVIAERPLSFRLRDEWSAGLRSAAHGHYHILFRDFATKVRIVRVLHGARDIATLFRPIEVK
jgi:toxin ParE1/3/4